MNAALRHFVNFYCVEHPAARMQLIDFVRAFKARQPARDRDSWTRGRVTQELVKAGFQIGTDAKVYWIACVALRGSWVERDGAMILEPATNV